MGTKPRNQSHARPMNTLDSRDPGLRERKRTRAFILLLAVALVALIASTIAGCSSPDDRLKTATDSTGFFHIKFPAEWQHTIEAGLISVYASDALPESDRLEDPALLIFLSEQPMDQPVPDLLTELIESRAADREWREGYTISEPETVTVGGRDAARVTASGVDRNGVEFESEYYLVRTDGREILVMAVAPSGEWDEFSTEVARILSDDWYWHIPEQSHEPTSTPAD